MIHLHWAYCQHQIMIYHGQVFIRNLISEKNDRNMPSLMGLHNILHDLGGLIQENQYTKRETFPNIESWQGKTTSTHWLYLDGAYCPTTSYPSYDSAQQEIELGRWVPKALSFEECISKQLYYVEKKSAKFYLIILYTSQIKV